MKNSKRFTTVVFFERADGTRERGRAVKVEYLFLVDESTPPELIAKEMLVYTPSVYGFFAPNGKIWDIDKSDYRKTFSNIVAGFDSLDEVLEAYNSIDITKEIFPQGKVPA